MDTYQERNWKKPFLKVIAKYGLTGSLVSIIAFILLTQIKANLVISNLLTTALILILFVFFSMKEFRDLYNNRELHFWHGILLGSATYLCIAVLTGIFNFIYLEWISPEVIEVYRQIQRQYLEANKEMMTDQRGAAWYNEAYLMVEKVNAIDIAVDFFLKKLLIGIFVTIIISVILRKVPKAYL